MIKTQIDKHRLSILGKPSKKKGIPLSDEVKRNISNGKKGLPAKNRIKVYQYKITGEYINEFNSVAEAQELTGTKGIYQVLSGKYKKTNNYLWSKIKQEFLHR